MARDGLLPTVFAKVHPRFKTPHVTTAVTGFLVAFFAAFADIEEMVDLCNIGTLFAFMVVCISIPILRSTHPKAPRPFWVPMGAYLLPGLGAASCVGLMVYLPQASWFRFAGWLMAGLAIYALYGYRSSVSGRQAGRSAQLSRGQKVYTLAFTAATIALFCIST